MIYTRGNHYGITPDSKVHWANMGPIGGRQDPGGPHVGPMNFAIWVPLFKSVLFTYRSDDYFEVNINHNNSTDVIICRQINNLIGSLN